MGADAPMPGRASPPWCPGCHAPPGPDCPDKAKTPRQVRRALAGELRREAAQAAGDKEKSPWT